MKLIELLSGPWAIQPDSLREIQEIYATHLKGDKIDLAAVEARIGRPLSNEQQRYTVRDGGVAVLPVEGVIAPKANLFTRVSGGTSAQMLVEQINSLAADSRVKSVIGLFDSPGGSVFGIPEAGQALKELAAVKPVVTLSEAVIASAAYWIGSAANAIYLTGGTVQAGSIGVVSRMGLSKADPESIEMVRGKYKRGGINGERPSADYMAYIDGQLDHLYSVFVDTVATHRGISSQQVIDHMGEGRVFIGTQAIDAGLADGIVSLDSLAEQMATNPDQFKTRRKPVFAVGASFVPGVLATTEGNVPLSAGVQIAGFLPEPVLLTSLETETTKDMTMDTKTLAEQHPDLLASIQAEAQAVGAAAERDRIASVRAQSMKGHEALIEALAADGKTTGPDAAVLVLAAERKAQESAGAAFVNDAPPPAANGAAPSDAPKDNAAKAIEAKAYAKEKGVSVVAALKALGYA